MPVLSRFETESEETAYVMSEREKRRFAIRALTVVGLAGSVIMTALNPIFFPGDALIIYNIVSICMIGAMAIAYFVVGTRYYLEWRWLDFAMFAAVAVAVTLQIAGLASTEDITGTTFLGAAVIYMGIILVFASIAFVANVALFLLWACGLMAIYSAYVVIAPIPIFPKVYLIANVMFFFVFAIVVNWEADRRARLIFAGDRALEAERAKTEELLYNVLPQAVAERLRAGEVVADSFANVSVIFIDIVGFSRLAQTLSPGGLVKLLNRFFMIADACATRHGVEKVKTIGDAYLAVSGGTASSDQGANAALSFAHELIGEMSDVAEETGVDVKVRVGIHTGPVVGGVVGTNRLAYDYWGDTMNVASRIEGVAEPGSIAVSAATYFELADRDAFHPAEALLLKGVGETQVYRMR